MFARIFAVLGVRLFKYSPNVCWMFPILESNIRLRIFREYSRITRIFSSVPSGMFAEFTLNILRRIFGFSIRGTFSEHSGNIQTDEHLTLSEYSRKHSWNIPWISSCYLGGNLKKSMSEAWSTHLLGSLQSKTSTNTAKISNSPTYIQVRVWTHLG